MTWHVPDEMLHEYLTGRIAGADAWSVEAHLTACERCRAALATAYPTAAPGRAAVLDETWTGIATRLPEHAPRVPAGTRWREARVLVAAGPAARWAWLAACALVLAFVAAFGGTDLTSAPWLGIVAPVVPLLGVAASYSTGLDDAYEVIASTPGGGLRLLLLRSAVVLAVTTPIALVGGALTGYGSPVPWLLASLALTLLTLAVGSLIGVERAAAAVGFAWLVAVGGAVVEPSGPVPALLTHDAVPAMLAAAATAAVVIAIRRDAFHELPAQQSMRNEVST
ncbi:MAG: anti-sigma factor family protein [Actinomycetota bacterium]